MDGKERAIGSLLALKLVDIHVFPTLEPVRLALRQARAHREIGLGQEKGCRIVGFGGACDGIGHGKRQSFWRFFVWKFGCLLARRRPRGKD